MLQRTLPWLVLLSSLGCGSDPTPPPGDELRSNESRLAASTDLGAVRALAANDAAFAMALHAELPRDENLFYSPHGISIALAMTYAGAAGDTAQEMRDTLRFAQEPAELHQAFNTLDQLLESRGEGQLGADGSPFRLRVVDAVFAQRGFPIHDRYLDDMARWYGAGLHVLDFATQTESARTAINAWVADATEDRIEELLPEGTIRPDTVLVLTNAVYFDAAWADAFSEAATTDGAFVRADGSTVTVPMMHGPVASRLGRGEGWIAAELPYAGDQVSMVVLLPDDLDALEEELDADVLDEVLASLRSADVSVTMPRFEARSHFSLKDALSAMGMASAFEAADFSNLTTEGGLRIADVIHEGFVRVDEKGTEAAAATAVIVDRVSLPESIVLDRPFLFFIRDVETNALLFVGRIVDPST